LRLSGIILNVENEIVAIAEERPRDEFSFAQWRVEMSDLITSNVNTIARAVVEMARDGRFVEMELLFAPPLRAVASAETVRVAWSAEISKCGRVSTIGDPVSEQVKEGLIRVRVPVICEHGELTVLMSVDSQGKLQGLRLTAPQAAISWMPPVYANPKKFTERDVTVGSGPLATQGTLSLPHGHGLRPGVVLLSGGGPFDRDGTSGLNKPLKDLAWGLVSRGVAVLRFDKVTYTHVQQVATLEDFTMKDEYVPSAVAAVRLLQQQPNVDATRVFLIGHSMGGKVAPRIAVAEPSIAGLVILAGDTQPMQQSAIRVARYLAQLSPSPASQAALETIIRQAALVESAELSRSTPATELPFGFSGSYWLDLRSYDPVLQASKLDTPMLILQGERDYQVTVEDDLSRWREGLGHRSNVTIRIYKADNHLFFPGTGPSTPTEYDAAQHVDPRVINDISMWLKSRRGKLIYFLSSIFRFRQ
jgi:dienelactone hydrolase